MLRRSIALTLLLSAVATSLAAEPKDRRAKVLGDREQFAENAIWIYNDLPRAFAEAEKAGKPLLVVFRCVPCEACSEFDQHLLEKQDELRDVLEKFVCVRVVYANGLDLSLFQFDFDQSFHAMILRADRTVLARYGTRSQRPEEEDMAVAGFRATLERVLEDSDRDQERNYGGKQPRKNRYEFQVPEEFPALAGKYPDKPDYEGKVVQSCIHCHQVRDAERNWYRRRGEPIPDDVLFPQPLPDVLGLKMDPRTASTVAEVQPGSLAATAELEPGDDIIAVNDQPIYSTADLQWALHTVGADRPKQAKPAQTGDARPAQPTERLRMQILARDKDPNPNAVDVLPGRESRSVKKIEIILPADFRQRGDLSWRPTTWDLRRMATGGMVLDALDGMDRDQIDLPDDTPALVVKHVGQYGDHAAALRAGFQAGDVIIAVDGQPCPSRETDFIRLALQKPPGNKLTITVYRRTGKVELLLPMQ